MRTMAFQILDVTNPLASTGRITRRGHRIVLDGRDRLLPKMKQEGRSAFRRKDRLHKKGSLFVMQV